MRNNRYSVSWIVFICLLSVRTVHADIYSPPTERGKACCAGLGCQCPQTYVAIAMVLDRLSILDPLPNALNKALLDILTHTSSERGRQCVPPIHTAGVLSPFTFRIAVKVDGVEYRGSGD
jgi:hypothetical protein